MRWLGNLNGYRVSYRKCRECLIEGDLPVALEFFSISSLTCD